MKTERARVGRHGDPIRTVALLATPAAIGGALAAELAGVSGLTVPILGVALGSAVIPWLRSGRARGEIRGEVAGPVVSTAGRALDVADLTDIRGEQAPTRKEAVRPETPSVGSSSAIPEMKDRTGMRIGRYTLEQRLAVGGMGEVWRASHDTLLRPAALKLIRPQAGKKVAGGERLERFRREAMITSSLTSPHTVDLFDFGFEGTTLYLAMELLDGMSLRQLVETHGPIDEARLVYLLRQCCHSLIEAHESGVVHRDIKPENILITRAGRDHDFVKIIDFGLVKQLARGAGRGTLSGDEPAPGRELTAIGARPGTPGYMAPEQIGGDAVDQRADIYALACVAYFALTGQPVFEGTEDSQLMFAHMAEEPEPPSTRLGRAVHPGLEAVIMRCLAKNPLARPMTMEALDDALAALSFPSPWNAARSREWWAAHPRPDKPAPTRKPTG